MKGIFKVLAILVLATLCSEVAGQSAIIRGEVSAGSYQTIKTDGSQNLSVSVGSIGTAPAAALADAAANPTTITVGADNSVFNGTTWDRWSGSTLTGATGVAKVTIAGKGDPCLSSEVAKSSAIINITTATTTQLVALSGTTIVYVCDFSFTVSQVVTTANTLKFVYGTGASCGTGTTDLTGTFGAGGVTAAAPIVVSATSVGTVFKNIAGNALCATTTIGASAFFTGVLTYVQQ